MQPLSLPPNAVGTSHAFAEAAESWLRRTRDPHSDAAVLDAVQRWQARSEPAESAAGKASPAEVGSGSSSLLASKAALRRIQGGQKGDVWYLASARPLLIGRSGKRTAQVDIDLWPDAGISRRHAMLWFDGEGWRIEDLRSKNGTFINETDIRGRRATRLQPGMRVRCGSTVLLLTVCEVVDYAAATPGADSQETEAPTLDAESFS